MKFIHLAAALCVATNAYTAANNSTDAQLIAETVHARVKNIIDPQYQAVQKMIKKNTQEKTHEAKKIMRAAQKKLQEECTLEKKRLQSLYNDKKRALYNQYQAEFGHNHPAITTEFASEGKRQKTLLKHHKTLKESFDYIKEQLKTLINQAQILKDTELATALAEEEEWLTNLEKTSKRAGIAFDQPLPAKGKKSKKNQVTHQAL